jgi:hypothetical protein
LNVRHGKVFDDFNKVSISSNDSISEPNSPPPHYNEVYEGQQTPITTIPKRPNPLNLKNSNNELTATSTEMATGSILNFYYYPSDSPTLSTSSSSSFSNNSSVFLHQKYNSGGFSSNSPLSATNNPKNNIFFGEPTIEESSTSSSDNQITPTHVSVNKLKILPPPTTKPPPPPIEQVQNLPSTPPPPPIPTRPIIKK